MKFSLITVTMGNRQKELMRLKSSLAAQTYRDFEHIVIDHREHPELLGSLSRARNLGLSMASGDVVAFPDDDIWYGPDTLEKAVVILADPDVDGISFRVVDEKGTLSAGWMSSCDFKIAAKNIWHSAVSCSVFLKRRALGDVRFDETLGLGSGTRFGSGEETDLLLTLIERGARLYYYGSNSVFHSSFRKRHTIGRAWLYGNGCGLVLRRHGYGVIRLLWMVFSQCGRAAQSILMLRPHKALFSLTMAAGRIAGYLFCQFKVRP